MTRGFERTANSVKGLTKSWSIFVMIIYLYRRKWRFLSERLMGLAILLYELLIHHAQISVGNTQEAVAPSRHD